MTKLLVNAPSGEQQLIEVEEGGGYFDLTRVVWDERTDGPLPEITLGGMVRSGDALVFDQARKDEHDAALVEVPQIVSFRQAKTAMQLYPVGDSDLWTVANAQADAIVDKETRIKTQNLLRDSTQYERQRQELIDFAAGMGLSSAQLDALFISAATFA